MEMINLQDKFALRVAGLVNIQWDEIRIHYENAEIDGVAREVFTSFFVINGSKQELKLPLDVLDLLEDLKKHKPQGQSQEWTWLEFHISNTGKYKFEYKYGMPPLIAEQIKYSK